MDEAATPNDIHDQKLDTEKTIPDQSPGEVNPGGAPNLPIA